MRFKSGLPAVMASGAVVALGMVAGFPGGAQASTLAEAGSQPGAIVASWCACPSWRVTCRTRPRSAHPRAARAPPGA